MKFPFVRLFCRDAGPASKPSLATRNLLRIPYILYTISYLLAASGGGAFAWDDENWGACQNKINERLYDLKREREQRLADFVGGVYGTGGVVIDDTTALTKDGLVIADGDAGFITRRGYYTRNRDVYAGGGGVVVQDGDLFYGGGKGVTIRSGQAYFRGGSGSSIVVSRPAGVSSTMRRP